MNGETTNLSIRMDKALKEQAEILFSELGMNMTTALNVFVRKIAWGLNSNKKMSKRMGFRRNGVDGTLSVRYYKVHMAPLPIQTA
ncbi:MAG: hypothetical protein LBD58_05950 [Treponema sp.]|jgi:hypothetical protein|nr:hypothetical protein [Treponema sp.]